MSERAENARQRVDKFKQRGIAHGSNPEKDTPVIISNFQTGRKHKQWQLAKVDITKLYADRFNTAQAAQVSRMTFKQKREYVEENGKSYFVRKHLPHKHYDAFCLGRLDAFDAEIGYELDLRLDNAHRAGFSDVTPHDIINTYF
jgi:hypothetical protein